MLAPANANPFPEVLMIDDKTPEDTPKPGKSHRTMMVTVVLALLGLVALIALNMN